MIRVLSIHALTGLTLLFPYFSRQCVAQVPAAVSDAIERSDKSKEDAINAFRQNKFQSAMDGIARCIAFLREVEAAADDSKMKELIRELLRSEQNRAILFCYTGVDNSDTRKGISTEWKREIEKLPTPQDVKEIKDADLVYGDWKVFVAYAGSQQHLADFYVRQKDYSRANWHFANAEGYFQKYESTAPGHVISDVDQKRWREQNKKRLQDLISTRGITEGMFVQNNGILQKWIGKVLSVDKDNVTVRVTYASKAAPKGFVEAKRISLKRNEIKAVEFLSIDAAIRGYK